jgi:hypothetical protein
VRHFRAQPEEKQCTKTDHTKTIYAPLNGNQSPLRSLFFPEFPGVALFLGTV